MLQSEFVAFWQKAPKSYPFYNRVSSNCKVNNYLSKPWITEVIETKNKLWKQKRKPNDNLTRQPLCSSWNKVFKWPKILNLTNKNLVPIKQNPWKSTKWKHRWTPKTKLPSTVNLCKPILCLYQSNWATYNSRQLYIAYFEPISYSRIDHPTFNVVATNNHREARLIPGYWKNHNSRYYNTFWQCCQNNITFASCLLNLKLH